MADPTDDTLLTDYFADLNPVWVPDTPPPEADGRRLTTVPVTKLYGDPLFGKARGVRVDQGTNTWLRLVLYSPETGAPLTVSVGQYSAAPQVAVRYQEATGVDPTVYVPNDADAPALASDGRSVLLPLPPEVADGPGVYTASVLLRNAAGAEVTRDQIWVLVERSLFLSDGTAPSDGRGPPTAAEVRTALRDHPGANRLLANWEFDYAELGQALVGAVQAFNAETPFLPARYTYTTRTFAAGWRRPWIDGALAYLFDTAATYSRRGTLPYEGGGLSVNDLDKERPYLAAAEGYRARFRQWARMTKGSINVASGWGSVGSGVGWYGVV